MEIIYTSACAKYFVVLSPYFKGTKGERGFAGRRGAKGKQVGQRLLLLL